MNIGAGQANKIAKGSHSNILSLRILFTSQEACSVGRSTGRSLINRFSVEFIRTCGDMHSQLIIWLTKVNFYMDAEDITLGHQTSCCVCSFFQWCLVHHLIIFVQQTLKVKKQILECYAGCVVPYNYAAEALVHVEIVV